MEQNLHVIFNQDWKRGPLVPLVIRIKPKTLFIVDTADSLTPRPQHIADTWEVREGKDGSMTYVTKENMCVCVCSVAC